MVFKSKRFEENVPPKLVFNCNKLILKLLILNVKKK